MAAFRDVTSFERRKVTLRSSMTGSILLHQEPQPIDRGVPQLRKRDRLPNLLLTCTAESLTRNAMATTAKNRRARERKTARMELRVAPSVRELIERATAVSGLAAGDLAYEGARRILEEHERMVLRGADRDAFLKAVSNPPPPAPRLIAALRRHRAENR